MNSIRFALVPVMIRALVGLAALASLYAYPRMVLNFLGFGRIDGKLAFILGIGLLVWALGSLKGRQLKDEDRTSNSSIPNPWPRFLARVIVSLSLMAIGAWIMGSPLDPNRTLAALVLSLSGIAIPIVGSGFAYRKELLWYPMLAASLAIFLGLASSLRAVGVDGDGRAMLGWSWQKGNVSGAIEGSTEGLTDNQNPNAIGATLPSYALPGETFVGETWPQWMGTSRNGVGSPMFPRATPNRELLHVNPLQLLWEEPIGPSWSSCVSEGGVLFTQEVADNQEWLISLRLMDGKRLWRTKLGSPFRSSIGGDGSRATPALSKEAIVAMSGRGELVCVAKQTGQELWRRSILEETGAELQDHGACGSPLIVGSLVYAFPGGRPDYALVGYSLESGELVHHGGDLKSSYGSLVQWEMLGESMIVAPGREFTAAYTPDLKRELWRYAFSNSTSTICSIPQKIDDDEFLLAAGYGTGSRRLRLSVHSKRQGEEGNVEQAGNVDGREWELEEVWKSTRNLNCKFSSTVLYEDRVYGLDDGILQCLDLPTGKSLWKKPRYGFGQLLLCGDIVVVQCEDGSIAFVDASTPVLRELGRFPTIEGKTWNLPIWSRPYFVIRNDSKIQCLRLPAELR